MFRALLLIGATAAAIAVAAPPVPAFAKERALSSFNGATSLAAIRSGRGLKLLQQSAALQKLAKQQAQYMAQANAMTHNTGVGKSFRARMHAAGFRSGVAENLAYGNFSTGQLYSAWMSSPGHRRNLLDPRYGYYGLASATGANGRKYWALVLSK